MTSVKTISVAVLVLGASCAVLPLHAQNSTNPPRPAIFEELIACRAITEAEARLACFDRSAASIDEAERSRQVMVIDRKQADKAERGLFGLSLPSVSAIFGSGPDSKDNAAISQVESTIKQATATGYGKWSFTLDDGATWATTEAVTGRVPKVGASVIVKRGSLGSFVMTAEGSRAVRVKRLN